MYKPVQQRRLYERIVAQIEARILRGEMPEGAQLPTERELADQFGVSRTAVREAIRALVQKGLIAVYPGRGTFVTNATEQAMRDTFGLMMRVQQDDLTGDLVEVRELLEPEIAALAAERAGPAEIAALEATVQAMDVGLHDPGLFIGADQSFHRALALATRNRLVLRLIDPIVDLLNEQRGKIALVTGGMERGQYHHKRILAAIVAKNPAAAREAMRAHLAQIRHDSHVASD